MKFRLFKIDHSQDTAESITKVSDKKEILKLKINGELLVKSLHKEKLNSIGLREGNKTLR
jgi:hypothetical protein